MRRAPTVDQRTPAKDACMRLTFPKAAPLVLGALLLGASAVSAQDPAPTATPVPQLPEALIAVATLGPDDDRGINQAVAAGAIQGAARIGASEPRIEDLSDVPDPVASLRELAAEGVRVIVAAPGLDAATAEAAQQSPDVRFIGVDHVPPCITLEGLPDAGGRCEGDVGALIPNYTVLGYAEDQAGYLAGVAAASLSTNGRVGAIGGIPTCVPCIRYMQGFELGARSVDPGIEVSFGFVTDTDDQVAFHDAATGRAFARAFIDVYEPDVLLAGSGVTGEGMMDAACDAGILAVGVDVDQVEAYPRAARCILTSARKELARSVEASVIGVAAGTTRGGIDRWDAAREGVSLAPFHDVAGLVPPALPGRLEDAWEQVSGGRVRTCPERCGTLD
jgi:basic membrane protein A and related proteins